MKLTADSGSPLAAAEAAAALDWARFAQAGRLRTLKLPGRLLKLGSDGVAEPARCENDDGPRHENKGRNGDHGWLTSSVG